MILQPLRAKGWEKALLEYTIAMLTDSASKSVPPLRKRLAEITCPGWTLCLAFALYFLLLRYNQKILFRCCRYF